MSSADSNADAALLARHRGGDPGALEELFARYYTPVKRFFEVHATWVAEDLTQRTFLACVEKVGGIDAGGFRAYLFGIARNQLKMYLRSYAVRKPGESTGPEPVPTGTGLSTLVARTQEQRRVLIALGRLDVELRLVVTLHYWEGFSSAELERILDVPASTIRGRLLRARTELKKHLERAGTRAPAVDIDAALQSFIVDPLA